MDKEKLLEGWKAYIEKGIIQDDVRPEVARSWEKCRRLGVDPTKGIGKRADQKVFQSIYSENRWLVDIAYPIMQNLHEIFKESHFVLVLTDSLGYILETIGDKVVSERADQLWFKQGALWNEEEVGSNAIGVALDQNKAIQMIGAEHYCVTHHGWTCSATPIRDQDGKVIGCLNMSGDSKEAHLHTLGIVTAAAFSIEKQIACDNSLQLMRTAMRVTSTALIVMDKNHKLTWMSEGAEQLLGMDFDAFSSLNMRNVFKEVDWQSIKLKTPGKKLTYNEIDLSLAEGSSFTCKTVLAPIFTNGVLTGYTACLHKMQHVFKTVNKVSGNRAIYTFSDVLTKSPVMEKVINQAEKYASYDGCVLIEGESGTGKELFAHAIHNASKRAASPFVVINCASLPRDLIESELFGYEKGAFTGALKEGNPGKFELADGGTIFLDEIGEMPMELQAKLLRIVETLSVRRLGGKAEKKLDVRVIAATNCNLKREVEKGNFREDLYYRLNVLKLDIPPLRYRKDDIIHCGDHFLDRLNNRYMVQMKTMSQAFAQGLEEYHWPGNVRELQNFIERVFYQCGETVIGPEYLPEAVVDKGSLFAENRAGNNPGPGSDKKPECGGMISSGVGMAASPLSQVREGVLDVNSIVKKNIEKVLQDTAGDVEKAAAVLGISRASMYRRIKKYDIRLVEVREVGRCQRAVSIEPFRETEVR